MAIELTSPAFPEGDAIPKQHTGDGADTSPPLRWSDPPEGTRSLALVCDDPDGPRGTWVHWVIFNLPGDLRALEGGVPAQEVLPNGARQGKNDFGAVGYGGPRRRAASRTGTSSSSTPWTPPWTYQRARPRASCSRP